MTTKAFLQSLQAQQISLRLTDSGKLAIKAADGQLSDELVRELRARKTEIIELLQNLAQNLDVGIPPAPTSADYPLSAAQQRLWVLDQISERLTAYNIPYLVYLNGPLNRAALERALRALVARHESLRTQFRRVDGEARQVIGDGTAFSVDYQDWEAREWGASLETAIAQSVVDHVFDLERGPLLYVRLVRRHATQHVLGLVLHHIVADAWSVGVLLRELGMLYAAYCTDAAIQLDPLPIQYRDFAVWQEQWRQSERLNEAATYWQGQLSGTLPQLSLPTAHQRPERKQFAGERLVHHLAGDTHQRLVSLAQGEGATDFHLLLASVQAFLHRYTRDRDLIVGTTSAGRNRGELQGQIGFYVNVLPVRQIFSPGITFQQLLREVSENYRQAIAHEDYPFGQLLETLAIETPPNRNPLFDVLVEMLGRELDEGQHAGLHELEIAPLDYEATVSKFDLAFRFLEDAEGLHIVLEYDRSLYAPWRMRALLDNYIFYLQQVLHQAQAPLAELPVLTAVEADRVLHQFQTPLEGPAPKNVTAAWEAAAQRFADRTAVVYGVERWTYQQLKTTADQIASHLVEEQGVQMGEPVAVWADRQPRTLAAILALLQIGATFVPLDPQSPAGKLNDLLTDSGARLLLLGTMQLFQLPPDLPAVPVALDILPDGPVTWERRSVDSESMAYLLYTSGSTGQAKGVAISQANLAYYLDWANRYYFNEASQPDFALFTSLAFDLSMTGLLGTLLRGASLHLYNQDQRTEQVLRAIFSADSPVGATKLTPSHLTLLSHLPLEELHLQCLIVGGEALHQKTLTDLLERAPGLVVHNEYGPTDATVGCAVATYRTPPAAITIGKAIPGAQVFILDEYGQPCPLGIPGELYLGGPGLARGYHQRAELTAERFVTQAKLSPAPLYRSGDRAYFLPDGQIVLLGRMDEQVKVRGHRVELGEIEAALLRVAAVEGAVVLAKPDPDGSTSLAAYLQGKDLPDLDRLHEGLEKDLAPYMIPAAFYQLPAIPLTANGKVDRKALVHSPQLRPLRAGEYVAAGDELEAWLLDIFQKHTSVARLGIRQNLFTAGLDSLKIVQAQTELEKRYPQMIEIHEIFSNPTVEKLARLIRERSGEAPLVSTAAEIIDF